MKHWLIQLIEFAKKRREARLGLRIGLAFAPALAGAANAQTSTGSEIVDATAIGNILCGISNTLSGPIGIAIGVVILAVGGLMIAFGGKRAISFVIWGIIGVGIALAAPALLTALFGEESICGA